MMPKRNAEDTIIMKSEKLVDGRPNVCYSMYLLCEYMHWNNEHEARRKKKEINETTCEKERETEEEEK